MEEREDENKSRAIQLGHEARLASRRTVNFLLLPVELPSP